VAIGQINRTDLGTIIAIDTSFWVDVAWLLAKGNGEVTGLSFHVYHPSIGQDLDVRMLVVVDVSRGY
jgi:hypothetical protein